MKPRKRQVREEEKILLGSFIMNPREDESCRVSITLCEHSSKEGAMRRKSSKYTTDKRPLSLREDTTGFIILVKIYGADASSNGKAKLVKLTLKTKTKKFSVVWADR